MKSESLSVLVTLEEIIKVYSWGISYGQAIMEQERMGEEMADAMACFNHSKKHNVPSAPAKRRQIHSEKWFETMMSDKKQFIDFLSQKTKEVSQ